MFSISVFKLFGNCLNFFFKISDLSLVETDTSIVLRNVMIEFSETVKSPIHEDFSYSSFSEGEKMRIDLALLFTWREVARVKNSVNTNLLIMDEVFDSSLDGFGTDEFLKIIRYIIKGANIFVISHKSDLNDKFENVIQFDKIKGFSKIVKE